MIALHNNCLIFELHNGESVPCSADMICIEIVGEADSLLEPDLLRHAAASVFHYFKIELARETVTVGEFSLALEKVLHHLGCTIHAHDPEELTGADLRRLLRDAGGGLELFFFPRLRDELRVRLRQSPRVVRFHGLRGCVKKLTGARRWTRRCEQMQEQIVAYLRGCLSAETKRDQCALVVE